MRPCIKGVGCNTHAHNKWKILYIKRDHEEEHFLCIFIWKININTLDTSFFVFVSF